MARQLAEESNFRHPDRNLCSLHVNVFICIVYINQIDEANEVMKSAVNVGLFCVHVSGEKSKMECHIMHMAFPFGST